MSERQTCFQEEALPVLDSIDARVDAAHVEIQQLEQFEETINELGEHVHHFDSIACGGLDVDEEAQEIVLGISNYTIGERIRTVIEEYEWEYVEIFWLEEAELFQVELTMEYDFDL